ncbi:MAG: chemotaxis-specific protein-glutamate methyltransferase CheB [Anaerolineae bacterium]
MTTSPIRVLLVDDSVLALAILKRILATSDDIEVVGTARNGQEALELIPRTHPDVICTDYHMPVMNGLEFIQEVMARFPCPILVVSVSVQAQGDEQTIFNLLAAGAIDVFPKPQGGLAADYEQVASTLIQKIRVLSGVVAFTRHRSRTTAPLKPPALPGQQLNNSRIVAIGASTGGPQVLHTILSQLPPFFPVPVLCVQHISQGFLSGLVDWLDSNCMMPVKIAQPGEIPHAGTIYFPQEKQHLVIDNLGRLQLSDEPAMDGHRPSVTVLFESVASYYGTSAVGVLLTGMGRDGAAGLHAIAQAGGVTIAQDEASCAVFGMPKQAIELGAAGHVLPPEQIAHMMLHHIRYAQPMTPQA